MMRVSGDTAFRLLANHRRRRLLLWFAEADPDEEAVVPADLGFLGDDADTIETELHHTHLPMLSEAGVLDWDRGADVVRQGPLFNELRPLLKILIENRDRLPDEWS
jgi:hypothetical protein